MRMNRNQTVAVRLTPDRQSRVKALAAQRDMNVSELIRVLIDHELANAQRGKKQHSSAVYTLAGNDGATVNA